MTLWETEIMEENARNRLWEELNDIMEEPEEDYFDWEKWRHSVKCLKDVIDELHKVEHLLEESADGVEKTGAEHRIVSMLDAMTDLEKETREQIERMEAEFK